MIPIPNSYMNVPISSPINSNYMSYFNNLNQYASSNRNIKSPIIKTIPFQTCAGMGKRIIID